MRIQTISTKYNNYIYQFYKQNKNLSTQSYKEQLESFTQDSFGAPETRTAAFQQLGYQTSHIFANVEPMQKCWADENNIQYTASSWMHEIILAQILKFNPDILFLANFSLLNSHQIFNLKEACPSIRLVLTWCGSPYKDYKNFTAYDIILSNSPEYVHEFISNGFNCYYIKHSFDPSVIGKLIINTPKRYDLSFSGSIIKSQDYHYQRESYLLELVKQTNIIIWSDIKRPNLIKKSSTQLRQSVYHAIRKLKKFGIPDHFFQKFPLYKKTAKWEKAPVANNYIDPRIIKRTHPPVFGMRMYQKLYESKVTFNVHGDNSIKYASNMRLFEATGVGTCLLTDWKDNMSELFEPDEEVVIYRSADECIEKSRYLLEHEQERQAIARAGQKRTLRDHTVKQRVEQIDEIIRSNLK